MKLARNMKLLRHEMRITQEKMAEKCDVSRSTLAKWESELAIPDIYMIDRIARIFNVTLDELVRGEGEGKLDEKELIYRKIEEVKEELIREMRNNKISGDLDLYEKYRACMDGQEMLDEDIPVDAYSYLGCEEAEKGNYDEAIRLLETALSYGDINSINYLMAIYNDVIDLYSDARDFSKYWEWRLKQAKKMQQYGKILETEILKGRVF